MPGKKRVTKSNKPRVGSGSKSKSKKGTLSITIKERGEGFLSRLKHIGGRKGNHKNGSTTKGKKLSEKRVSTNKHRSDAVKRVQRFRKVLAHKLQSLSNAVTRRRTERFELNIEGGEPSSNTPETNEGESSSKTPETNEGKSSSNTSKTNKGESSSKTPETNEGKSSSNTSKTNKGESSSKTPETNEGKSSSNTSKTNKGESSSKTPETNEGKSSSNTSKTNKGESSSKTPETNEGKSSSNTSKTNKGKSSSNTSKTNVDRNKTTQSKDKHQSSKSTSKKPSQTTIVSTAKHVSATPLPPVLVSTSISDKSLVKMEKREEDQVAFNNTLNKNVKIAQDSLDNSNTSTSGIKELKRQIEEQAESIKKLTALLNTYISHKEVETEEKNKEVETEEKNKFVSVSSALSDLFPKTSKNKRGKNDTTSKKDQSKTRKEEKSSSKHRHRHRRRISKHSEELRKLKKARSNLEGTYEKPQTNASPSKAHQGKGSPPGRTINKGNVHSTSGKTSSPDKQEHSQGTAPSQAIHTLHPAGISQSIHHLHPTEDGRTIHYYHPSNKSDQPTTSEERMEAYWKKNDSKSNDVPKTTTQNQQELQPPPPTAEQLAASNANLSPPVTLQTPEKSPDKQPTHDSNTQTTARPLNPTGTLVPGGGSSEETPLLQNLKTNIFGKQTVVENSNPTEVASTATAMLKELPVKDIQQVKKENPGIREKVEKANDLLGKISKISGDDKKKLVEGLLKHLGVPLTRAPTQSGSPRSIPNVETMPRGTPPSQVVNERVETTDNRGTAQATNTQRPISQEPQTPATVTPIKHSESTVQQRSRVPKGAQSFVGQTKPESFIEKLRKAIIRAFTRKKRLKGLASELKKSTTTLLDLLDGKQQPLHKQDKLAIKKELKRRNKELMQDTVANLSVPLETHGLSAEQVVQNFERTMIELNRVTPKQDVDMINFIAQMTIAVRHAATTGGISKPGKSLMDTFFQEYLNVKEAAKARPGDNAFVTKLENMAGAFHTYVYRCIVGKKIPYATKLQASKGDFTVLFEKLKAKVSVLPTFAPEFKQKILQDIDAFTSLL